MEEIFKDVPQFEGIYQVSLTIKINDMLHEIYLKETKEDVYSPEYSAPCGSYNDDYVHWLERKIEQQLKILNIPVVVKSGCPPHKYRIRQSGIMKCKVCGHTVI